MELLKHTLYINLESRTDRLAHVQSELSKIGVTGERVNAVKTNDGAIGCSLSHIKCLELAKSRGYPYVFIVEDDITFLDPQLLMNNMEKFEKELNQHRWDVLVIGGNNSPPYNQVTDYCIRVFNNQTTTGYIAMAHYYDILISNFKESVQKLMRQPSQRKSYALDIYWKRLQQTGIWIMIVPPTVIQYADYSDIEKTVVDYKHLMLDMRKEWLFGR
jgi:GR25 family glycosyltransferase involved in LPS biosynthesis